MSALDFVVNHKSATAYEREQARAELAQLRATVAEQAQQLAEARELFTALDWNDWDERVDTWLAANPAPVTQEA